MTKLTRIVAAVVDTKRATLYREDGETIIIEQGDVRLRKILEQITPDLQKQGWAEIDLSTENSYKEFEEKTNGAVRLFRIAKSKLASLFGGTKETENPYVPERTVGTVPSKTMAALNEIIAHATPVSSQDFNEQGVAEQRPTAVDGKTPNDRADDGVDEHFGKHEDTIIAVTPKGNIVPGVERIKSQFKGAVESGSTVGMTRFLERLGAVIKNRSHTVEDLLRFMERGDLPVADDGTIVIYKKLFRKADGTFVDPHTRKVVQRVGSYVHMDISLVDKNRRNECSNGLHVARRGYIGSFSGDVITMAKVRPEDVIAVPDYDSNKMRVCGYHIVAELTRAQYAAINNNRPISDAEGGVELLSAVVAGDHIGITEMVKIGGHNGTNLTITKVSEEVAKPAEPELVGQELPQAAAPVSENEKAPVIKKRTSKKVIKADRKAKRKAAAKKAAERVAKPLEAQVGKTDTAVDVKAVLALKDGKQDTLQEQAKPLLTQADAVKEMWNLALEGNKAKAQELLDFKKAAKKGWHVWGLPDTATATLKALL